MHGIEGAGIGKFLDELPQPDPYKGDASSWILNVDDVSLQTGAGVNLQLRALTGERIKQAIRLGFLVFNNETKYEVILARVNLAKSISLEKLIICSDSHLVVGQVNGEYETGDHLMVKYASLVN